MANRRMFNLRLTTNNDKFHALTSAQRALYFDLMGFADDDGLVANVKQIVSFSKARKADLEKLIAEGWLLCVDEGIYCITHWKMHNSIPADKYMPTQYKRAYGMLELTEECLYTKRSDSFAVPANSISIDKGSHEKYSSAEGGLDYCNEGEAGKNTPPHPATKKKNKHGLKNPSPIYREVYPEYDYDEEEDLDSLIHMEADSLDDESYP